MKKLDLIALACASLFTLGSSSLYAGNQAGSASLTVGGGYDFFASKRQMQNTGIPFAALGYNFTEKWGIEGFLSIFSTRFDSSSHDHRQINGTLFAVDGVYRFSPRGQFEPFVTFGVGIQGLNPTYHDANNEGNINAGLGAQYFLHEIVAIRADVRDFYTTVGGKNDVIVDAGITFLWNSCSKCLQ